MLSLCGLLKGNGVVSLRRKKAVLREEWIFQKWISFLVAIPPLAH
jgi:hypothetical protein